LALNSRPLSAALFGAALLAAACSGEQADTRATDAAAATAVTTQPPLGTSSMATTTIAPTTALAAPRSFSAAFSGDVLMHSPLWRRAERYAGGQGMDFRPMFQDIAPLVSSVDLAVCHMETPIAPPGEEPQTYPRFGVPGEVLPAIASAGYERCSTASNHSMDQGTEGIVATLDALDALGLGHSGTARSASEAVPQVFEVNGVRVAHLSFTRGFPVVETPAGEPWWVNNTDIERILADARLAREQGAEVVIVSMHWGTEPEHPASPTQRSQAEALAASGLVNLIVGHHTHVVQPIEQINGVWTVFGLGNSISNMPTGPYPPESQDGLTVTVDFEVALDGTVTVARPVAYPTVVDRGNTFEIKDIVRNLARTDLTARERAFYEASLARTAEWVGEFIATVPAA
jgi:poly-gamma-glutamate synthesis protein (capsule biosynthesis protein)